jgi:hypothetical protein
LSATTSARPTSEEPPVTIIRITVDGRTFTAQLADNPTARDLVDQLPLTLRFRDFNRVEKIAELPRPLIMDGVPAGADPERVYPRNGVTGRTADVCQPGGASDDRKGAGSELPGKEHRQDDCEAR